MEIAKMTSKGQITIPIEVRKRLKLSEGDKVVFIQEGDRYVLANSSLVALHDIQSAMIGVAEESGLNSDEDVMQMIHNMRNEKRGKKYADHG